MKKITILLIAVLMTFAVKAQDQLLSHSTSQLVEEGSVACAQPNVGTTENNFWRAYTPAAFGETGTISLQGGQFGISFAEITSGSGVTAVIVISAVATDNIFPNGPTDEVLATATVTVGVGDDLTVLDFDFLEPVNIPADMEVAIKIAIPDGLAVGFECRLGQNDDGETAPTYISTDSSCGPLPITSFDDLEFPGNGIINLRIGDEILGVDSFLLDAISVYPNPATDVLNIKLPSQLEVINVSMFDVLGRNTGVSLNNGQVNLGSLEGGIYLLKIQTMQGTITEKVIVD